MINWKDILFFALILAAPHANVQTALWIMFALLAFAFITSDALADALRRLRSSMSHYD